jgi:TetR/AcrR family transcriptional regulator, cholesterol catabolism regulator
VVQLSVRRSEPPGRGAEERRREILAAASRVFRRKGFAATGMRDVAAELGMTAGNLYYYFAGKQEILAFCQEATLDELLSRAGGIVALDLPAAERLALLVRAHVTCLNETYPGSLAHLEIEALAPARRAPLASKRRRYERTIGALIAAGVASGELRAVDPRLATLALLGALNWTVKWFSPDGALGAAAVGDEFAHLFLDGLRAHGTSYAGQESAK